MKTDLSLACTKSVARRMFVSLALIGAIVGATSARAARPQEIDASIQRAVNYLYSVQQDGTWEALGQGDLGPDGMHHGGLTAIATYALLAAGENPSNPRLAKALLFLRGLQTQSVYVIGMRAQVWSYLPKTGMTKQLIGRDTQLLIRSIKRAGDARGLYYYPHTMQNQYDHSISQFGVLGLWAGIDNGAEVPEEVWTVMDRAWRGHQSQAGGWSYMVGGKAENDEGRVDLAMTCAGVASLLIISDYKNESNDTAQDDPQLDLGLKWIADNFKTLYNKDSREDLTRYYTLYGLERIGVASGYKYFGNTNWFADGSDLLLRSQADNGSWGSSADLWGHDCASVPDTCFGILFFVYGKAPVVINKLSYINAQTNETYLWNARPRDIANLTRWAGKEVESLLNWHVVSLANPITELHDAPILYVSGYKPLAFSDADVAKLRQFVEEGGMILANANNSSPAFATSARTLGEKMFPSYEFRELPATHLLYTNEQFPGSKFKPKPRLMGLSNGVREMMLLLPEEDASHVWQTHEETSDLFPLGADIIQYATEKKGLDEPLPPYIVQPDPGAKIDRSATVARLDYETNWNPEPGGWRRLATVLHNQFQTDLSIESVKLGKGQLAAAPVATAERSPDELRKLAFKRIPPDDLAATGGDQDKLNALIEKESGQILAEDAAAHPVARSKFLIAHLTGTSAFTLTEPQRQDIKNFVNSGGTLVVDAAGGSSAFATSAEKELTAVFGADALQGAITTPLPLSDQLYALRQSPITNIAYRTFSKQRLGHLNTPRLAGIVQNGRTVAYYSREDLTAGLVGEQVDGIDGYTPDSATAIMRNIVLLALKKP
jgi:hypothetical protein